MTLERLYNPYGGWGKYRFHLTLKNNARRIIQKDQYLLGGGEAGEGGMEGSQKDMRKFGAWQTYSLHMVMISQVYTDVKTYHILHLKHVGFTVHQLNLSKDVKKKKVNHKPKYKNYHYTTSTGCVTASVSRICDSWSCGYKFKPHVGLKITKK